MNRLGERDVRVMKYILGILFAFSSTHTFLPLYRSCFSSIFVPILFVHLVLFLPILYHHVYNISICFYLLLFALHHQPHQQQRNLLQILYTFCQLDQTLWECEILTAFRPWLVASIRQSGWLTLSVIQSDQVTHTLRMSWSRRPAAMQCLSDHRVTALLPSSCRRPEFTWEWTLNATLNRPWMGSGWTKSRRFCFYFLDLTATRG